MTKRSLSLYTKDILDSIEKIEKFIIWALAPLINKNG